MVGVIHWAKSLSVISRIHFCKFEWKGAGERILDGSQDVWWGRRIQLEIWASMNSSQSLFSEQKYQTLALGPWDAQNGFQKHCHSPAPRTGSSHLLACQKTDIPRCTCLLACSLQLWLEEARSCLPPNAGSLGVQVCWFPLGKVRYIMQEIIIIWRKCLNMAGSSSEEYTSSQAQSFLCSICTDCRFLSLGRNSQLPSCFQLSGDGLHIPQIPGWFRAFTATNKTCHSWNMHPASSPHRHAQCSCRTSWWWR